MKLHLSLRHILLTWLLTVLALLPCLHVVHAAPYDELMHLPTHELVTRGEDYTHRLAMPDSALICFTIASNRPFAKASTDEQRDIAHAYINKWYLYFFHFFDHSKAFDNIEHANEVLDAMGDEGKDDKAVLYLNYGCMYETLAEQSRDDSLNVKAMQYLHQAFALAEETGNLRVMSMSFSNLVYVAHVLGCMEQIDDEYQTFAALPADSSYRALDYNLQMYRGLTLLHEGQWAVALDVFEHQMDDGEYDKSYLRYEVMMHNNRALCLATGGRYDEAIDALRISEDLATADGLQDAKLEIYRFMTDYAHEAGRIDLEHDYHTRYLSLKDTLLNYNQLQSISQLSFLREVKEIDQRMADMQHRSQMERMWLIGASLVALLTLLFVGWLSRQNRELKAANRQLYQQSVKMLATADKERSIRQRTAAATEAPPTSAATEASADLAPASPSDLAILDKVRDVMENSPAIYDPDFTLERLAQQIGEKYRTVSRIINDTDADNASQYINRYRIDEACRRINDTQHYGHLSLEAIANSVGFRSRSSFGSAFKRFTGLTPSEYQRMARTRQ